MQPRSRALPDLTRCPSQLHGLELTAAKGGKVSKAAVRAARLAAAAAVLRRLPTDGSLVPAAGPSGAGAVLVDARAPGRAPPTQAGIFVTSTTYWRPLRLRKTAGRWELGLLSRSIRPARGRMLGSFTVFVILALLPWASVPPFVLARLLAMSAPFHLRPEGRGGVAGPAVRRAPPPAGCLRACGRPMAGPPPRNCSASSPMALATGATAMTQTPTPQESPSITGASRSSLR